LPEDPVPTKERAEITAIILALNMVMDLLPEICGSPDIQLTIHSDSKYAATCVPSWINTLRGN
jgi:ribonuclease HI